MKKLFFTLLAVGTLYFASCKSEGAKTDESTNMSVDSQRNTVLDSANNSDFMNEGPDSMPGTGTPAADSGMLKGK